MQPCKLNPSIEMSVDLKRKYSPTPIKQSPSGKWLLALKRGWPFNRGKKNLQALIGALINCRLIGVAILKGFDCARTLSVDRNNSQAVLNVYRFMRCY